jgi:arylsulfatase A-like enzyme
VTAPAGQAAAAREPAANLLLLGVLAGLLNGLGEGASLLVKKYVFSILILHNPHIVWMGPLVYVVCFYLPLAALWIALNRALPRVFTLRLLAALFAFLAAFFVMTTFRVQLTWWAIWAVIAGCTVQGWSLPERYPAGVRRLLPRAALAACGLIAAGTMTLVASRAMAERRAVAALGPAPAGAPNVLLLILDTVRALDFSLYGYDLPTTPHLERFGAAGAVFEHAVATTSWTNPSHATLFTGRFPYELTADWSLGLDATHPTLAEVLRDRGYLTGGFMANTRYLSRLGGLSRGFVRYEDHPFSLGAAAVTTTLGSRYVTERTVAGRVLGVRDVVARVRAPDINRRLLRWLDAIGSERPFFATLNYMDGHLPYRAPPPFAGRFPVRGDRAEGDSLRAGYNDAIAYLDDQLRALLDSLERRGRLANTIVVITSDHGEELGEHGGVIGHAKSLYWPALHVPLLVYFPGRVPAGVRVATPVSLREVAATILDLAGVERAPLPGRSLARFWSSGAGAGWQDTILSELTAGRDPPWRTPVAKGDMKAVVIGTRHYILNGDGREELYDIAADPWETNDLIAAADSAALAPFRAIIAGLPRRDRVLRRTFF